MQIHQHRTFIKLYGCSLIDAVGEMPFSLLIVWTQCAHSLVFLITCFFFSRVFVQLCIQPELRLCLCICGQGKHRYKTHFEQSNWFFAISSFCHKFRVEEIIYWGPLTRSPIKVTCNPRNAKKITKYQNLKGEKKELKNQVVKTRFLCMFHHIKTVKITLYTSYIYFGT